MTSINWYIDVIKGEQALTDIAAVQLDAGSQSPRQRRKCIAVDQYLKLLKEAYEGVKRLLTDTMLVLHITYLALYNNFYLYRE